jgi:ribose 5-phosphate isomerase B
MAHRPAEREARDFALACYTLCPMSLDLEAIARRAVQRALAERGLERVPREAVHGIHVVVSPGGDPARPAAETEGTSESEGGREVVTERSLAIAPDGGAFRVPNGAIVTPAAREAADRRGIVLVERPTSLTAKRGAQLRVAVGADHGGFALKRELVLWLRESGHSPVDLGTRDENPVDYPDFARAVAEAVASGQCDFGICIDGAGIGSAIAANKVPGVRAAACNEVALARNAREHNYANVLTLGARFLTTGKARDVVLAFLATQEGEERHAKRVAKIDAIERRYARRLEP